MRVFVFATNTSPRSSSVGRSPCDTLTLKRSRTAFAYSSCDSRRTGVGPTMFGSLHSVSAETPTPGRAAAAGAHHRRAARRAYRAVAARAGAAGVPELVARGAAEAGDERQAGSNSHHVVLKPRSDPIQSLYPDCPSVARPARNG